MSFGFVIIQKQQIRNILSSSFTIAPTAIFLFYLFVFLFIFVIINSSNTKLIWFPNKTRRWTGTATINSGCPFANQMNGKITRRKLAYNDNETNINHFTNTHRKIISGLGFDLCVLGSGRFDLLTGWKWHLCRFHCVLHQQQKRSSYWWQRFSLESEDCRIHVYESNSLVRFLRRMLLFQVRYGPTSNVSY